MPEPHPLDRVIRQVTPAARAEGACERLVSVDARSRRAVARRLPWADLRHYLVRNHGDPRNEALVKHVKVVLSDLEHAVTVYADVQASCPAGREEKLAEALFDASLAPAKVLERDLTRWLMECSRDSVAGFVRRYFADPATLHDAVSAAIAADTGMQVRVKLKLHEEDSFNLLRVTDDRLRVLVSDYDEEQEMSLRVELDVDDENRAAAALHAGRNAELQQSVPREVKRFIRAGVTLQQFCTELATGSVAGPARDALARRLDEFLRPAGRRVSALVLQATSRQPLPPSFQRQVDVPCRVREYPDEVVIRNTVQLLLKDAARYRASGSKELGEWLEKTLAEAVPLVLFEARYIDLLIRFEPWVDRIKAVLAREADAIGYEIRQFITVPELAPIRLKEKFAIDTEGSFETRLRNVVVRLQVNVSARIPDLQKIETLLNSQQNVADLMEKAVLDTVREYLHGIDPERFYMRFSFTDPQRYPDETRSVEAELLDQVRERLQGHEFHAEVIRVVIKIVDTDLITRFRALQGRICPFAVVVGPEADQVTFRGDLRVISVDPDGWHNFQTLSLDVDQIREQVETHLNVRLHTRRELLRYQQEEQRRAIETFVSAAARLYAAREFGLAIEVGNLRREWTRLENSALELEEARSLAALSMTTGFLHDRVDAERQENEKKVEQLTQLLDKRAELVAVEGTEPEIAALDLKIAELKRSLGEVIIPSIDRLQTSLLGRPSLAELPAPGAWDVLALPESIPAAGEAA
ncbi:MAG TPA: hypothetical protein VF771_07640 [Longimicrobiaceae bacterium]